jgi:signal transduction histidine kinase
MERWKRLLGELQAEFLLREEELRLLHEIDLRLLASERPLNATFDFIVDRTQQLLSSDHAAILLRRGRFLEPAYSTTKSEVGQQIEISSCLVGECLDGDTPINVPDITAPQHASRYVSIRGYAGPPMQSLIAAPVKVHGTVVGVLAAESTRKDSFTSDHTEALTAIAAQVAMALQRVQAFNQNALFAEVDHLILDPMQSHGAIQLALHKVMDSLRDLEHVDLTGADILFRQGRDLEIVHSTNPSVVGLKIGLDESICGRAIKEHRTVTVADVNKESDYRRLSRAGIQSEIAIPILLGDDSVAIGVLNVESAEPNAFQGFAQVVLESFAGRVRSLLAFAKLRSDLTDALEVRNANDLLIAVGDQASDMAHRLNNTVGSMRLRLLELQEMAEDGDVDLGFMRESLEALLRMSGRALEMPEKVTKLLSQNGNAVDVSKAVVSALADCDIPENVSVELDLVPEPPLLNLYCFDVVVQNLLRNAADAMPDGGTLTVTTSIVSDPELLTGYVQLVVRDTGTGIPPDILPRIFDLNFTTKRARGTGLGLGLWWVRNFVRRANGEIAASSTVGTGSEFVVRMPYDRSSEQARPALSLRKD